VLICCEILAAQLKAKNETGIHSGERKGGGGEHDHVPHLLFDIMQFVLMFFSGG